MTETESLYPSADRHELELRIGAELERLPGILTAAAWLAEGNRLRDARIVILPGAAPTIIANAASRVLQALGVRFEPVALRITTAALPDAVEVIDTGRGTSQRVLLLHDLSLARSGAHVNCRVQLARQGTITTGEARELDTAAGRVRAAALATLRAAEQSAEGLALGLENGSVVPLFGRSYAAVSVEASIGRRAAILSAMVPVDPTRGTEEAVCLATLRAIDRWIGA